jgi:hypothetical protein
MRQCGAMTTNRTRLSRLTIVIAGLGLLVGCSAGSTEAPRVATVQSGSPAADASRSAGSPESAGRRPVFSFDATEDDKSSMAKPWEDCMVKNAGAKYRNSAEELIGKGGISADDPKGKAALKTCLPKQPESFEEHQLRTDLTAFQDNQREWYRCAQAAGYKLGAPDRDTGQFGLTEVGPNGDFGSPAMQECKRKAFAD